MSDEEETITIRFPISSWTGIVRGIEKWAGDSQFDIEILSDYEILEPQSRREERERSLREVAEERANGERPQPDWQ